MRVSDPTKEELRLIFRKLCLDVLPPVRAAAAANFGECAKVMGVDHVRTDLLPIIDQLVKENLISLLDFEACVVIAGSFSEQDEVSFNFKEAIKKKASRTNNFDGTSLFIFVKIY